MLCVWWKGGRTRKGGRKQRRVQSEKQESHTVMWGKKHDIRYTDTVVDRILEMKKGSCAAVSRKGWGPKTRQKISDITDFQKKEFWK